MADIDPANPYSNAPPLKKVGRKILGNTNAGQAADDSRMSEAYNKAKIEANSNGEDIGSQEEWKKTLTFHDHPGS